MSNIYDVVIIGAGTAGLFAASEIKKRTTNFVIINSKEYGTTCARVGCMPSKLIIHAANQFHQRLNFEQIGIKGANHLTIDIPKMMQRVRSMRDIFVSGVLKGISSKPQFNIQGTAKYLSPNQIQIIETGQIINTKTSIIATGSSVIIPPQWQHLKEFIITSDDIFELEDLPQSIAVIGLGIIGIELGTALSKLGLEIIGIEKFSSLGGLSDPVVIEKAKQILGSQMPMYFNEDPQLEITSNNKIKIQLKHKELTVDKVLMSVGRKPNLEHLDLEKIGVKLDAKGIPIYDFNTMQIQNFPIFIAGDATGVRPVYHEAQDTGIIAGYNAVNPIKTFERKTPLSICFTEPNIATCGNRFTNLNQEEVLAIGSVDYEDQGRAKVLQHNHGTARLYFNKITKKLLGAEMITPAAEHFAHMLSWCIQSNLGINELINMPFYHPTLEEGIKTAIRNAAKQLQS